MAILGVFDAFYAKTPQNAALFIVFFCIFLIVEDTYLRKRIVLSRILHHHNTTNGNEKLWIVLYTLVVHHKIHPYHF